MQLQALEILKQAGFEPHQAWAILRAIEIELARAGLVPAVGRDAVPHSPQESTSRDGATQLR